MFENVDLLEARFRYLDDMLVHHSLVKLPENIELKEGVRFGITVSSDARVGKELLMVLCDLERLEKLKLLVVMITAEHLQKTSRGWFSMVEIKEVIGSVEDINL